MWGWSHRVCFSMWKKQICRIFEGLKCCILELKDVIFNSLFALSKGHLGFDNLACRFSSWHR